MQRLGCIYYCIYPAIMWNGVMLPQLAVANFDDDDWEQTQIANLELPELDSRCCTNNRHVRIHRTINTTTTSAWVRLVLHGSIGSGTIRILKQFTWCYHATKIKGHASRILTKPNNWSHKHRVSNLQTVDETNRLVLVSVEGTTCQSIGYWALNPKPL